MDPFTEATDLIRTALLVPLAVCEEVVVPGPDEGEFGLRLEIAFRDDNSSDMEPEDIVEWGAVPFAYLVSALSFADARTRGNSEREFVERDTFGLADFIAALRFRAGALSVDLDYLRGRRVKTHVVVRANGTGTIETVGRGKAAARWLARITGERPFRPAK